MVTPEILDFIKKKRVEGMTDELIRQDLLKGMWSEEDIHIAFTSVDQGTPIPTNPSQSQVDTRTIVVILTLVLFYPLGLVFMWWWMKRWSIWIKILITSIWALFFLLYIGLFAADFYFSSHIKKVPYQPIPSQSTTIPTQTSEVIPTNTPIPPSTSGANVTTAPTGTTKANGICVGDNGCKFRSPGSGFRCDTNGNFSSNGSSYCSCNQDCSVSIQ